TAPRPDHAFVARLEADLMTQARPAPAVPRPFAANGHQQPAVRLPLPAAPRPERRRWPITEALVAAVVLLAIAVSVASNRSAPTDRGPEGYGLAAIQPATVPATNSCTLEPRAGAIVLEGRPGTPVGLPGRPAASMGLPTDVPPAGSENPFGVPEELLPAGAPASAEIVAGIRGTLLQRAICPRDRELAVYSDDYFRRAGTTVVTTSDGVTHVLFPVPILGVDTAAAVPLRDARVLADGRVGAVVEERAFTWSEDFLGNFYVFVEQAGRWLIDEVVVLRRPAPERDAAATPAGTWFGFAPTHRVSSRQSVNLRPDPSFDNPPIVALPPETPLQYLEAERPAQGGTNWLHVLTEDGQEGWIRDVDVEPIGNVAVAPDPTPTVEAPTVEASTPEPTPTLSAQAEPVVDLETAAEPALGPTPREERVQADLDGVLAGDPAALDGLRAQLRGALAGYGEDCRAGFVLVSGNGELGEGNELARAVLEMLQTDFAEMFGEAAGEPFAQPGVEPRGEVTLQIYFFQGCQAAMP
ncbi:MAG: SH3 domain-containing protein, partial [Chloroflexota bacterium]|nr:SH3 domain-containing protein [Chloroflexota bacterium]